MATKEELLKSLEWRQIQLDRMKKTLQFLPLEEISEQFPQGEWQETWLNFEFCLPMDFKLVNAVKDYMQSRHSDWTIDWEDQIVWDKEKTAGYFVDYKKSFGPPDYMDVKLCFAFRSAKDGSTCVLHQIGTKEVPVYEVTCPEGAEEEL